MQHRHLFFLAGTAMFAANLQAAPTWKYVVTGIQVVDLQTMGGKESVANDINDQGEIVGWSQLEDGSQHAFLWRNGGMEDITPYGGYIAEARGINNLTQVVGYLRHLSSDAPHGFQWDARNPLHLLDEAYTEEDIEFGDCASGSDAKAINDSGVITGIWLGGCNPPVAHIARATRWLSKWAPWDELMPLGHAGKQHFAYNINSAGTIVGWDKDGYSWTGAFRWNQATGGDDVPFPPTTAPAWPEPAQMKAFGINDNNAIVGTVKLVDSPNLNESEIRAFHWDGSSTQSSLLPRLVDKGESAAFEINAQSFSVGYSDNRHRWAVLWHPHIGIRALTMPAGAGTAPHFLDKRCEAVAVNARNASGLVQAVGHCVVGGNRHAVLWNINVVKAPL